MTLSDSGWFSWTIQDPGPENRILSTLVLPMVVVVHHSMEGQYNYPGGYIVLRDPEGWPTAWHWTVKRDGRVLQHYGAFRHLQHGHAANVLGPGGESEGVYYEPLTPEQVASWRRIHTDINEYRIRTGSRPLARETEWFPQTTKRGWVEHREMAPTYNTTQCPSGRYLPLWATYQEDDMTPSEREEHEALVAIMGGRDKILANAAQGNDFILGYTLEQAKLAEHVSDYEIHTHDMPEQATSTGGITR